MLWWTSVTHVTVRVAMTVIVPATRNVVPTGTAARDVHSLEQGQKLSVSDFLLHF